MSNNVVEFSIKAIDDFSATLGKLDTSLGVVQKAFVTLAAAYPVYKAIEMTKASLDNAESMWYAAQRAETSTSAFSAMAFAAKLSNVDVDGLSHSMKFLGQAMAEGDTTPAGKELIALGISAKDPTEAMLQLADAFKNSANTVDKTSVAIEIFKRGGTGIVPFLNQGSAAIKEMMQDAKDLGQVIGDDFGASANQINDNLIRMHDLLTGSVNKALAELAPTIETLTGQYILWSKEQDAVNDKAEIFAITIKSVITGLLIIESAFSLVITTGKQLVGVLVAASQAAQGHFKDAMNTLHGAAKDGHDALDDLAKNMKRVEDMWNGSMSSAAAKAAKELSDYQSKLEAIARVNAEAEQKHKDLIKAIDDATFSMGAQVKMFGQSSDAIKIYEFQLRGATDAQLKQLVALTKTHDGQVQAEENYKNLIKLMKEYESPEQKHAEKLKEIAELERELGGVSDETRKMRERENATWEVSQRAMQLTIGLEKEYRNELEKRRDQLAAPLLSSSERILQNDLRLVSERAQSARIELEKLYQAGSLSASGYDLQLKQVTLDEIAQKEAIKNITIEQDNNNASWEYGANVALRNYMDAANNTAKQTETLFTNAFKSMSDALVNFVKTGKLDFASLADSIISDLIRIEAEKAIAFAMGGFGGGGGIIGAIGSVFGFANGGIMSSTGAVPLKQYAGGGIADSPQIAMFGEGSMNEAYVPLPDGRSIPVTMKGGGSSGQTVVIQNLSMHILENATGADVFSRMNKIDLRNKLGQPIIDALNELYKVGKRPDFAMQVK